MAQYNFGSGVVWGTPTQDAYGAAIANPSPLALGVLQDISVDFSRDIKTLYGQNQFPVAAGAGKGTITGKASYGQFNGALLNSLFFGQSMTSSLTSYVNDLTGAPVPASTPWQITPTIPGAGTWAADMGVRDVSGNPMTRVATGPTTGQYSVTAGVYTFSTADAGKTVYISYQYTATSTTAKSSVISNIPMGTVPMFRIDFFNQLNGNSLGLTLYACVASKLSLATKLDDFLMPEIDFTSFADPLNRVFSWSSSQ